MRIRPRSIELLSRFAAEQGACHSARRRVPPLFGFLLGLAVLCVASNEVRAAAYALDWWDTAGGGTVTGGTYTLSGSIGQPDAGSLTGGAFTLNGGFWGQVLQEQIPGIQPTLSITLTTTNGIVLKWASPSTGFVLQEASDLQAWSWSDTGIKPSDDSITLSVVLPSNNGTRFYRLKK